MTNQQATSYQTGISYVVLPLRSRKRQDYHFHHSFIQYHIESILARAIRDKEKERAST